MSDSDIHESPTKRGTVASLVIDASPHRVFRAFSDRSRLARWWGPDGFTNTITEFNLRPGGEWSFVMHGPDGTNFPMKHVFIEVNEPDRIVIKHLDQHLPDIEYDHDFEMTITFSPQGSATLVGWSQIFDSEAEWQRVAEFVIPATAQNLDRLASEVLNTERHEPSE
jgi:uncharacterized protein YndB with AHSA1/START domain